jgi:hypothetical protein
VARALGAPALRRPFERGRRHVPVR